MAPPQTSPLSVILSNSRIDFSIKDREAQIAEACKRDLGKAPYETFLTESGWLENDIVFATKNLHKWAKDEKAPDIDFTNSLVNPKIRKDPLGCVLIIG
jgi:beta-apo-4'-carotenal oxygenase